MKSFGVDLGGVVDLLSRHIYSGPEVFLRELLQNARDAIVARADRGQIDPAWTIRVIPADAGGGSFQVIDDGIGLSADEVEELLSTVGRSSKRDALAFRNEDFLGHFGIGLLSCFMVADTIAITTRKHGHPAVRWEGSSAGTFTVTELDGPAGDVVPIGTRVTLAPAPDEVELLGHASVRRLLTRFCEFLPLPVYLQAPDGTADLITRQAPFLADAAFTGQAAREAMLAYGERLIGHAPLDAIQIDIPETGTRGVAYVLANQTSLRVRSGARIYLGRMLLAEEDLTLVPDWAFFLRVVISSDGLTPTASRESLVRDDAFEVTREGIGEAVRDWVSELAEQRPMRLHQLVQIHGDAVRAACVADEALLAILGPHLSFETAAGTRRLADIAAEHAVIEYATSTDEFRMLGALGAGGGLVDASYLYHQELLEAVPHLFSGVEVRRASLEERLAALDEPPHEDAARAARLAAKATAALAAVDVEALVKVVPDARVPSLYVADAEVLARVDMRRAAQVARGPWASALGIAGARSEELRARVGKTTSQAQVALNWANPLVQRLADLDDDAVVDRSVRLLYVQALLAGRRPLTQEDRELMSQALDDLVSLSIGLDQRP